MYERNVQWVENLVREQNEWRMTTVNLIASENVMSRRAREVLGSDFAHRYAEGHPGERYTPIQGNPTPGARYRSNEDLTTPFPDIVC